MRTEIKNTILTICLSLLAFSLEAQIVENRKLAKIVEKIETQEYLFEIYELSAKSIKLANKLNEIATDEELIELANMDCKLCFCYSFWVLSKRNSQIVSELYGKYDKENTEQDYIQINNLKKNKSCVQVYIIDENFISEIHTEKKYLNKIKTAYNS